MEETKKEKKLINSVASGVVEKITHTYVTLNTHPDTFFGVSRYSIVPELKDVRVGDEVKVQTDKDGFIVRMKITVQSVF